MIRWISSALVVVAALLLVTGGDAGATEEVDPCKYVGCPSGARACADIEIPYEGCEEGEPEIIECTEKTAT